MERKAKLTPKLLQAHLSNVKDSFYLLDNTALPTPAHRRTLVNQHIEIMLTSKLYGANVILIALRRKEDLSFAREDLRTKYKDLAASHQTIEVQGPKTIMKGIQMPGKKEKLAYC